MEEIFKIKINNKYFKIPAHIKFMSINGEIFAHFEHNDLVISYPNVLEDYSINIEPITKNISTNIEQYIEKNFDKLMS